MIVSSVRVWILVMEEMMTYTMCMTRPGDERVAQQTLSTGQVRMSTETCTEMIWRSWFKPTGELTRDRYCTSTSLGGVYMTPGRLLPRSEFTPVPSHGSIFVYMIPPQISCWRESPRREFTSVLVPGREFHSGTKSRNGIM